MSSTQNSQNLLVNVLRPVYTYSSETGFTAGVVATNLKAVNTDAITAGVAQLGDTGGNIYLGSNAGSTTIGTNSNNVAFGVGAASGINGVQNSVFIGASAGQGISNASNDVVIGAGTSVVGSRNIVIGNNDLVTGSNNFVIASDTILTGSYKVNIGNLIQGDISAKTLSFTTGTDISGGGYFGGNVGIRYPNPTHSLDVSGSIYATSNIILSDGSQNRPSLTFASDASAGMFRDALGNVGFARGGVYSMKLDPSGSILYTNLTVEGTLACATFDAGGIAATNLAVPGYIRNNDLTFNMDMSQGNLAFTGTGQSRVGNVFISNARLTASNGITGTNFDLSSGNLILSNNVVAGGLFSNTATNTSNYLGGVYLVDNEVRPSRLLEKGTGAFDLCSNGLSLIGKITGGDDTQSNRIGGIILSNSNAIVPGFIRNALTPTTLNISGGNISNSGNTTSSNFTTITASSNNIGGVVLNATNVSNVGTLGTTNALVSGYLRNALTPSTLDISGGNISNSGITRTTTLIPNNLYPVSTSDISAIAYIRMGGGDVSNLPFLWFRQGGDPARYSGINFGSFNTNSMYFYNANGTLRVKSINTLATSQAELDACASVLSINQTGKVGIGVESPNAFLDIGRSGTNGGIQIYGLSNNNITRPVIDSCANIPTNTPAYEIRSATVNGADGFLRVRAGGNGGGGGPWANHASYIDLTGFSTLPDMCNNIVLGTAGTERVRIGANGRVGIGSTAPVETLDVCGNLIVGGGVDSNLIRFRGTTGDSNSAGDFTVMAERIWGGSEQSELIIFKGNDVGASGPDRIRYRSTQHVFQTSGSEAWTGLQDNNTRMVIMNDGNVGIGTSTPASLLTVAGDISYSGKLINSPINNSNFIGGVVLSNGYMRAGVGTFTAPGISFISDPSSGLYSASSNMGIATAGLDRISISSNGTINIGSRFYFYPDYNNLPAPSLCNGFYFAGGYNSPNSGRIIYGDGTGWKMHFSTKSSATVTDRVTITDGGGVGIGVSPISAFQINDSNFGGAVGGIYPNNPLASNIASIFGLARAGPTYAGTGDMNATLWLASTNANGSTTGLGPSLGFASRYPNFGGGELIWTDARITGVNGGVLAFETQTGGALYERMRISQNGRVGIGTSSPGNLLDICSSSTSAIVNLVTTVGGTAGANGVAYYSSNMTSGTLNAYIAGKNTSASNSGAIRYTHVADGSVSNYIAITGAGASGLNVRQDGRVGIGTTNPQKILDISSATGSDGISITAPNATVVLRPPGSANTMQLYSDTSGQGLFTSSNFLQLSTNSQTGNSGLIVNGNKVGIGTSSPGAFLDVNAGSALPLNLNRTVAGQNLYTLWSNSGSTRWGFGVLNADTGSGNGGCDLNILSYNDGGGILCNTMVIKRSNGNIGMGGNTAPSFTLDVTGTIRGSSNIVAVATTSNWINTTTGISDTSLTIVYTPKQSGTVTLLVDTSVEASGGGGSGPDSLTVDIRNNANVLSSYNITWSTNAVDGRTAGQNTFAGGRMATTTVTGATPINIRIYRSSGDDPMNVRNGYLRIMELSTT